MTGCDRSWHIIGRDTRSRERRIIPDNIICRSSWVSATPLGHRCYVQAMFLQSKHRGVQTLGGRALNALWGSDEFGARQRQTAQRRQPLDDDRKQDDDETDSGL